MLSSRKSKTVGRRRGRTWIPPTYLPMYKLDELSSKHAKWLDHMSNLSQAIKDVQPIPMSINGILLIPPNSNVICIKWMVFLAFIRGYIILGRPQSTLSSRCRYKSNSFFRINQRSQIIGMGLRRPIFLKIKYWNLVKTM